MNALTKENELTGLRSLYFFLNSLFSTRRTQYGRFLNFNGCWKKLTKDQYNNYFNNQTALFARNLDKDVEVDYLSQVSERVKLEQELHYLFESCFRPFDSSIFDGEDGFAYDAYKSYIESQEREEQELQLLLGEVYALKRTVERKLKQAKLDLKNIQRQNN